MSQDPLIFEEFARSTNVSIKLNCLARDLTTYAIGGGIPALVELNTAEELQKTLKFLNTNSIKYKILGAGSNLLVSDQGLNAWVIKLGKGFRVTEQDSETVFRVGGAYSLMSLSRELTNLGLSGLEFAGGIPASIGGAVYMNAGAHKHEICEVIKAIDLVTKEGELLCLESKDLNWSYRRSNLPKEAIVIGAKFELVQSTITITSEERTKCLNYRKETQPLTLPSAGSVFKNPSNDLPAGKLIEELGLKDTKIGGAEISSKHANWIVNPNKNASFNDVISLVQLCQSKAESERGVRLELEQVVWE